MPTIAIDLKKTPCYWLTCEKAISRHAPMKANLERIGLSGIQLDGEITKPYTFGVTKGHLDALSNKPGPVLLLEDDATPTHYFKSEFEIPANIVDAYSIDAIYLGTSLYGRNNGYTQFGGAVSKDLGGDWLRVFNMLSMHAVLYLSDRYVNHICNLLDRFDGAGGVDDRIAETMDQFNILAPKYPMFYQQDGHSERATLTPLTPQF
jgi:hypothetical protein